MRRIILPLLLAALFLLSGCGTGMTDSESEVADVPSAEPSPAASDEENSISFFAMDTYMNIRAWGADDDTLKEAEELVTGLESRLSTTDAGSEISALNSTGSAELSGDTAELLARALEFCGSCDGCLDISVYPVVRAWGFTTGEYRVPSDDEIDALLEKVDWTAVKLNDRQASVPEGAQIDLGSIAKGYTGDRIVELLRSDGVTSAILDLGGNVQVLGAKPDGSDWHIAIQDPEGNGIAGVLSAVNKAVITSGGYERYFIGDDGELYWHIMEPATGRPAKSGLISTTIIGESGARCDALSTALFVMGEERAIEYWREHRDFEMVLIREDGAMLISPGLVGSFTQDSSSTRPLMVIEDD